MPNLVVAGRRLRFHEDSLWKWVPYLFGDASCWREPGESHSATLWSFLSFQLRVRETQWSMDKRYLPSSRTCDRNYVLRYDVYAQHIANKCKYRYIINTYSSYFKCSLWTGSEHIMRLSDLNWFHHDLLNTKTQVLTSQGFSKCSRHWYWAMNVRNIFSSLLFAKKNW